MRKTSLNCVYELAKQNKNVVFIGSDLGPGVLEDMKKEIPNNFIMEGVSEQHIIGMAAGMAMEGFIPYVNTIATFLTRRCFEQIAIDLCLHDLPVRLIANGGGLVYAPLGPTHLATDDISILRTLPNMTIVAPCDADEMRRLMLKSLNWPHPIYIRLAKGGDEIISREELRFNIGKSIMLQKGKDGLFISTGVMTQIVLKASKILEKEGISIAVMHVHTIKPFDKETLLNTIGAFKAVVTVEEQTKIGGLGSSVLEILCDSMPDQLIKVDRIGMPDKFSDQYGSQETLLYRNGITVENIVKCMKNKLKI